MLDPRARVRRKRSHELPPADKRQYAAAAREIGAAYREVMGRHFPAMSVVEVSALLEDEAKVEIEATAVLPV